MPVIHKPRNFKCIYYYCCCCCYCYYLVHLSMMLIYPLKPLPLKTPEIWSVHLPSPCLCPWLLRALGKIQQLCGLPIHVLWIPISVSPCISQDPGRKTKHCYFSRGKPGQEVKLMKQTLKNLKGKQGTLDNTRISGLWGCVKEQREEVVIRT